MVSHVALSAIDLGFERPSGQTDDYRIVICCFYAKHAALMRMSNDRFEQPSGQTEDYKIAICCLYARHAALRSKSNDWFAQKQNNVLSDTSTKELFKSTGTMKIQLDVLV
jgi:hypothetical protein